MKKGAALVIWIVLSASWLQAAPYEFNKDLDAFTWGESVEKVITALGQPYNQDAGGLTYIMRSNWIKRLLFYKGQLYQIIEQVAYAKGDPGAGKEYESLKQNLMELYGQPTQTDAGCPRPRPDVNCRMTLWESHPVTQIFVVENTTASISIILGITYRPLRQLALSNTEMDVALNVGQLLADYKRDPGKYRGQKIKVTGQAGYLVKTPEGELYLRLHNPFKPEQELHCYLSSDRRGMIKVKPMEGSVQVEGIVGSYENNILRINHSVINKAVGQ
jgi:hypothetical protein